jgi:hypothetical protein
MKEDLVLALAANDQESTSKLAINFRLMERSSLFSELYIKRIVEPHLAAWIPVSQAVHELDKVDSFISNLSNSIAKEHAYQRGLLEGYSNMPAIVKSVFSGLNPSLAQVLLKFDANQYPFIVEVFSKFFSFALDLQGKILTDNQQDCLEVMLKPFLKYQLDYKRLEGVYLELWLSSYKKRVADTPILRDTKALFKMTSASHARCLSFTFGYALSDAAEISAKFFKLVIEKAELEVKSLPEIISSNNSNSSEFNLVMINLSDADWAQFNTCLAYFEDAVLFLGELKNFKESLTFEPKVVDGTPAFILKELQAMQKPPSDVLNLQVNAVDDYCKNRQSDVLQSLVVHINPHVESICKNDWTKKDSKSSQYDIDMPQFSHSPLTYITAIGEYLVYVIYSAYTAPATGFADTE